MQHNLGDFIRAHRERITPERAGLPAGGRRRTPGLRREELAQLCEVSPTWLTWLEQGREVAPSGKLLARLAEVLQLSAAERGYLFSLAERLDPQAGAMHAAAQPLQPMVDAIDAPAYVLDRRWDALAWNAGARTLFGAWLAVAPEASAAAATAELPDTLARPAAPEATDAHAVSEAPEAPSPLRPNLLRFMFRSAAARGLIVDWDDRASRLVAEFRADIGKHAGLPAVAGLISELAQDSAEFRARWTSQDVVARDGGLRRFQHPSLGALAFTQVTLHLAGRHDVKLVMLLP
ncbi:XRE family transcriptional regulator [Duganella sp. Leaf126]|uniref:helix-turn-helix transcriptional regulator n=1 Tax=Duganella sp. Leaf126 TaxID=1736266 RepID=UPI0006F27CC2|nr:helix-turn-helix transcriptional regulator [Duganella sp. Leaf126]KQQ47223.1 XRE family transcriptional regulator [Duganella sp. Leaf126]